MKDSRIETAIAMIGFFGLLFVAAHWVLTILRQLHTTVVYNPDGSKHYHQTVVYDLRDNKKKEEFQKFD